MHLDSPWPQILEDLLGQLFLERNSLQGAALHSPALVDSIRGAGLLARATGYRVRKVAAGQR